jgi:hypothetical protein
MSIQWTSFLELYNSFHSRIGAQCAQDTNLLNEYGMVGEKGVLGIKSVHHPRDMVVSKKEIYIF